jgi:hypothetical protein
VQQLFAALVSTQLLVHEQLPLLASINDACLASYPSTSDEWLVYLGSHCTGRFFLYLFFEIFDDTQ